MCVARIHGEMTSQQSVVTLQYPCCGATRRTVQS